MGDETSDSGKWTSRDWATLWIDIIGLVGIILAIGISIRSLEASTEAINLTAAQLEEAKYESVYGHQLDLWKLAVEQTDVAPYIVGGKYVSDPAPADEKTKGQRDAAVTTALDFYAYIFSQLAPRHDDGTVPSGILTATDPPDFLRDEPATWNSWRTWAETIKSGFKGAPSMCSSLLEHRYDYEEPFFNAVFSDVSICSGR